MSWVIVATYPKESEHIGTEIKRWTDVAEDMALIPERNVQLREEGETVYVEVSEELDSCMRGV